jgi:hypothetical protein
VISLLINLGIFVGLWAGYSVTKDYVARRLRYVDAVQKPAAPIIAGVLATAVALPIAGLLPFIGAGTAVAAGVAVALGVMNGVRQIRGVLPPG